MIQKAHNYFVVPQGYLPIVVLQNKSERFMFQVT